MLAPRRVSARISFKPLKRELMRPWALDLAAYSDSASRASASTYRRPRVTHFALGRTNTSASLGNVSGMKVVATAAGTGQPTRIGNMVIAHTVGGKVAKPFAAPATQQMKAERVC